MEPPSKRQRLTGSNYPELDLHSRRAQNDMRLKSIFESIFEKYGRDFDGIGDEIDMKTGEIVINNGHIRGMADERDVGDIEYSFEKEDGAVIEDLEASEKSVLDTDSLLGDIPADSRLHQFGKESKGAIPMPSDDEEDELASSDHEWVSYKKNKLGPRERFPCLKDKYAFVDEPAIEPVWNAPPLPNTTRLKRQGGKVELSSVDYMREYSDDERAGVSLWTPEVRKRSRPRPESITMSRRSLPFPGSQENNADGLYLYLSDSELAHRKRIKWTQEEDELLIHLKTTTNLSSAAMETYFPERRSNSIKNHWTYMKSRDMVSSESQVHTRLGPKSPLPSPCSSTKFLTSDGLRPESSKAQKPQATQQQINEDSLEAGILVQGSNKPVEGPGDHLNPRSPISRDHGTTSGYIVDEPTLFPDVKANITGSPPSSARECDYEIAEFMDSNEIYPATDRSHDLSKPPEIEDDLTMHRIEPAFEVVDRGLKVLSEDTGGAHTSSPTIPVKAKPGPVSAEPHSDGNVIYTIQPGVTIAFEPSILSQNQTSRPGIRPGEPICPTVEEKDQSKRWTAEELRKPPSTDLDSPTSAHSPDYGITDERVFGLSSKNVITRQIVQVVIPLVAKGNGITKRARSHLSTTDPALVNKISGTAESVPAALGATLLDQQDIAIRTPTRSPSVAAAESQHAASAAIALNDVRSSLGIEIADSQPLSTTPVGATPASEPGDDAARPIVLDDDSPPPSMGLGIAPSAQKQLKRSTKTIFTECNSQPLRVSLEKLTPPRKRIEEATESDIVESGFHPLIKPLSSTRSRLKRPKKGTVAEAFSPVSTAIEDYSEDELSYL